MAPGTVPMIYLGIDPGLDGGIAKLDDDGRLLELHIPVLTAARGGRRQFDIAGIEQLVSHIEGLAAPGGIFATVERLQPLPAKMGGSIANYNRGMARGWEWLLVGMRIPYQMVTPQKWQSSMFVGVGGQDPKQRSVLAASQLFPKQDWRRSARAKKPHDGFTDAALIGEWGRRRRVGRAA